MSCIKSQGNKHRHVCIPAAHALPVCPRSISPESGCVRHIGFTEASLSAHQSGQRDAGWSLWEQPLMDGSMFTAALHHQRGTMLDTEASPRHPCPVRLYQHEVMSAVWPLFLYPVCCYSLCQYICQVNIIYTLISSLSLTQRPLHRLFLFLSCFVIQTLQSLAFTEPSLYFSANLPLSITPWVSKGNKAFGF